jgi:cellulose synthase/poly-beta-1,6-N-acetylglucosamine synthase-like glycosyltransferase
MRKRHDALVFIPAWNEQDNLPDVLAELRREIPGADVLVVDDGSTDRTADVAREHGTEVLSSARTGASAPPSPPATDTPPRTGTTTAVASTRTGSIP